MVHTNKAIQRECKGSGPDGNNPELSWRDALHGSEAHWPLPKSLDCGSMDSCAAAPPAAAATKNATDRKILQAFLMKLHIVLVFRTKCGLMKFDARLGREVECYREPNKVANFKICRLEV